MLSYSYSLNKLHANLRDYRHPDLLEPHILRSLSNVQVASVHTGCSACHFVVIDVVGNAWIFGRNGSCCLGVPKDDVDAVSENAPMKLNPVDLGAAKGTKFTDAACGRNHTLLVDSNGQVWTAGANSLGQVNIGERILFLPRR